jgi:hypothetical protein
MEKDAAIGSVLPGKDIHIRRKKIFLLQSVALKSGKPGD